MMAAPVHEIFWLGSQIATGALASAIWQGTLLACAAVVGLRMLPETPPSVRFAIWFVVFGLIAVLPVAGLLALGGSGTVGAGSHAWLTLDARWCVVIAAAWAIASAVRAATLIAAGFRVRALWKRARPMDADFGPAICGKAQVCVSDEVDRPTVIGFFSPRIVIPEWLVEKLTPEEMQHVVLHEAGHLSRGDDWLNLLQKLALVVFPLNPALAWVERRLCFERELACDERVLRATGEATAYASCLANLAEYRMQRRGLVRELALALGALGRESELGRRVVRILSQTRTTTPWYGRTVLTGGVLTLLFAATALDRSPQLIAFAPHSGLATQPHTPMASGSARAIAVRAEMMPRAEWKTAGDARPTMTRHVAVRVKRGATSNQERLGTAQPRMESAGPRDWMVSANDEGVPLTGARTDARTDAPRVFETIATTRQMTPDGHVVVTRWVQVSSQNDDDSQDGVSQSGASGAQQGHPYAAVPVRGGWLVFQL